MALWRALWKFEYGLAAIGAGSALVLMMLITVASVFGRYVLQMDLVPGGYNVIERVLFPLVIFWALPIAHREGIFPRFEMIAANLSRVKRHALAAFVGLVEFAVYAVVLHYVWQFAWRAVQSNRTMQIGIDVYPVWPIILMIPFALALMMLEMVRLIWRDMRMVASPDYQPEDD
jgi:TRAP-type mannitol/chloroaromatic compound transport system permease small subunit